MIQEHSSSRVLCNTNKFCSKVRTERKGHQKFNNMKKLASNQGGYYHILKARNGTPNIGTPLWFGPVHCQIEPSPTSAPCRMDGVWSLEQEICLLYSFPIDNHYG
jgi:hypothetical protein